MLQHVRQCFLHDAVERGLGLGRQARIAKRGLYVHGEAALLLDRVAKALDRRHEPEVVEGSGPQLDRESADVLQGRDDEIAELRHRGATVLGVRDVLERLQSEEDGRERLPRLVVELAREARSLELLRLDDAADRVAAHTLATARRPSPLSRRATR